MSVGRWCALLALAGCARVSPERNPDTPATAWHAEVVLDEALGRAEGKLCFEHDVPRELRAGRDEAASRLIYARWLGPGPVRRLPVENGRIQLHSHEPRGCVGYAVNLNEGGSMDAAVRRVGGDVVASPNVWLWRPERRAPDLTATLDVKLPDGMRALLPWPHDGARYRLDAEAFRFDSYAAFGHFTPLTASEGTVAIEAAVLAGGLAVDDAAVLRWLRSCVRVDSLSDGAFPRERLTAILVPSGVQSEPVAFGMVARGGGASVLLLVGSQAKEPALLRDWVLPHELSHLLMPFVERDQAWLSEGLATYYQGILLARAGLYSEQRAFREMAYGLRSAASESWDLFEAGADSNLVDESARMRANHNYHKVYWGGAAFWLGVDVELRRRTQGHVTVDAVLAALRREEREREVWTAAAFLERLDALSGTTVFAEARKVASTTSFPPFEPLLSALGVRGDDDHLQLDDAAPLAELRRQIVSAPEKKPR